MLKRLIRRVAPGLADRMRAVARPAESSDATAGAKPASASKDVAVSKPQADAPKKKADSTKASAASAKSGKQTGDQPQKLRAVLVPEYAYIDPRLDYVTLRNRDLDQRVVRSVLSRNGPVRVLDGDWDTTSSKRFSESDFYQAFEERFVRDVPWEETAFYERVVREIENGKVKWGCQTREDFDQRCREQIDGLFERMKRDGYKTQRELGSSSPSDEVRFVVDRNGQLMFMDGRHRLATARVLGLERIPVRISLRHRQWVQFMAEIEDFGERQRAGMIYHKIDHPDLVHIPAVHETDRFDMLEKAVGSLRDQNLSLLDIGTHWGAMTHFFDDLGFDCTATELIPRNAYFVRKLRDATGRSFDVIEGDVYDLEGVDRFDVVVALNIFHHFIKTEELHEGFTRLLQRLDCRMMLFEAHRHDPPGQMEGAYRNYTPEEFVGFVAEHARLPHWENLGKANDGRTLFKLWRD